MVAKDVPFDAEAGERHLHLSGIETKVQRNLVPLWIVIEVSGLRGTANTIPFPAVIDTRFRGDLLIHEAVLEAWSGIEDRRSLDRIRPRGVINYCKIECPEYAARVSVVANQPGTCRPGRDYPISLGFSRGIAVMKSTDVKANDGRLVALYNPRGLITFNDREYRLPMPILGANFLCCNELRALIDGNRGSFSMGKRRSISRLLFSTLRESNARRAAQRVANKI